MLFQSLGISDDSSEIEPTNSCYMMLMDGLGEPLKQQKNNSGELENSNNQNYLIVAHHITTFFCCCQTLKHLYVIFHTHSNQSSYSINYCYFNWLTPKYILARGILNTPEPQIYLGFMGKIWASLGVASSTVSVFYFI